MQILIALIGVCAAAMLLWYKLRRSMCDHPAFRSVGAGIASENFSHHLRIRGYIL